ncbi:ATP-dependent RNA helicase, putative [Trypanosoma cruzi marinkellei]|uniref:ATP-dependent RNA helicase n=1 Tax=Trypanosoma cruzi marinkellei TaxID=85056 RepID=K2MSZ9_TRYCR|nr:ATP-dependent RNA helicase, putative [Trypanosoma cruzi marinkellei]
MTGGWDECIGESNAWLFNTLQQQLHYEKPLPVQQAVIPVVQRAVLSGIPMDFCLTAPTGSGKTLCYLLPMLHLVTDCKKGVDHTRLRALVLVPTKALGTQVFRELQQLTRGTSIAVESLCKGDISVKEEAESIVRCVTVVNSMPLPGDAEKPGAGDVYGNFDYDAAVDDSTNDDVAQASSRLRYYSRVDILVATPQRLLRHLDGTPGLSLADLRFLVIDEADQVLAGNFANFVAKVVERFESEQVTRVGSVGGTRRLVQLTYNLHKMLCSATLSSHIARISEVRLRNCRHFALDSFGSDIHRGDEGEPLPLTNDTEKRGKKRRGAKDGDKRQHDSDEETDDPVAALPISRQQLVRTSFALPPRLQEHVVFVEDWYRHAVLLKLVRAIIAKQTTGSAPAGTISPRDNNNNKSNDVNGVASAGDDEPGVNPEDDAVILRDEEHEVEFRALGYRRHQRRASTINMSSPSDYPSCSDDAGKRILVFCRTAEEARVMGHFLLSAGVKATEFTTLSTESERRRALLKSSPDACIVASDALMRGVDVPNVGHVIMYNPPETLAQYVHRAGRTARAMRAGHLHLLLQKNGPSGTQKDGEVAVFKALSAAVSRHQPVLYERHFFIFDKPPNAAMPATTAAGDENREDATTKDRALLLVEEADGYLKKTQARLATHWSSAIESSQKERMAKRRKAATGNESTIHAPSMKKERKS